MTFNLGLVNEALYAAFATKNVGDTLTFPSVDPVFSNGADIASAPSIANISGITTQVYELRQRYLYMKYAFTVETLQFAGIANDAVFQEKIKHHFQNEFQNYIRTIVAEDTIFRSPTASEVVFEFNTISAGTVKVARAYTPIRYWFKLP